MSFCTECGNKLGSSDRFCSSCGTNVAKKVETKSEESVAKKKNAVTEIVLEESQSLVANSTARISPIYGSSFKRGVHCPNCGAKPGNGKLCNVCQAEN